MKRFSSLLVFSVLLLLFFQNAELNASSISTKTQNDTNGSFVIGAIVDMTSRAGKEAGVAMQIAINDFNAETKQNMTLYIRNTKGKPVQAAHEATYLIGKHKVDTILGQQTLFSVAEVGHEAQIPIFSLFDTVPQWALDRWPYLVQASPSQSAQMEVVAAILQSFGWNGLTFIYENVDSTSTHVIPRLTGAAREARVRLSNTVELFSSSSLSKELERVNKDQCRVFLVHTSLDMGIRLFQNARRLGMMERGYVWITTNLITDLLHTVNSSTLSLMEGVLGLASFFPDTGSRFHDFSTKFQHKFEIEHPEEESNTPGIFAVQAYDATWAVALALSESNMSGQKLLERISPIFLHGITGDVRYIDRKSAASDKFRIVNVIGKHCRQVGFWSSGLGFSETINDGSAYNASLQSLGDIFWPGRPLQTPRGWAIPTSVHPLRVGVPTMSIFKKFVEVKYDEDHNFNCTGYSIELFKETVKRLPYNLPYEFHPFNGTYDELVQQVYMNKFDAVVGDVSVVSRRYQYVEFTHPYTEVGLVMITPITSHHEQWLFVKPFTSGMWALIVVVNIYNSFVVWLIERKHSPELQRCTLNQTGILLRLAFTRIFSTSGDQLHSNLTRMTTVAWLFTTIIIGQCYTASLTSMLTVSRMTPKVVDIETLKNADAAVGSGKGSQVTKYLEDVLGFKPTNIRKFASPEEYALALHSGEISALFLAAPVAKLFLAKYCKGFIAAGPPFREGGFAFVLPKGSPMLPDLTKALINVSETGTLREMENKMIGSEQCVDLGSTHDEYESLGLHSFWSLFVFTSGTSTIALAMYAIISLRNHYNIEGRSLITVTSDAKEYFVNRRRRLSRKVSDVESPTQTPEMTRV